MLAETPDLYYHILPYAQVLGVSDIWTDKFRTLTLEPPRWVHNTTAFDILLFHSLYWNTSRMLARNLASRPASRSGGGFGGHSGGGFGGGGGFSGGGFGGGGSGRW